MDVIDDDHVRARLRSISMMDALLFEVAAAVHGGHGGHTYYGGQKELQNESESSTLSPPGFV